MPEPINFKLGVQRYFIMRDVFVMATTCSMGVRVRSVYNMDFCSYIQ